MRMPMVTRRSSRRGRRAKRRWLWTGIQFSGSFNVPDFPQRTIVQLLAPSQVATIADLLVVRVVLDFWIHWDNEAAPPDPFVGWYITVLPTDVDEVPVGAAAWDPLSTDIDATQKRPMHWRRQIVPEAGFLNGTGTMWGAYTLSTPVDITVRRKLAGDEALCLVVQQGNDPSFMNLSVLARVLCSVGRK